VVEVDGEHELAAITIENTRSGERACHEAKALFVFIGASPHTEWLDRQVACDDAGFLLTGRDLQGDDLREFNGEHPLFLETSRPGIFAVGDVHAGSIKRVASAVGEGAMAVRLIHERLAEMPLSAVSEMRPTPRA
jgi:thioredoxin reductase (NADPH)